MEEDNRACLPSGLFSGYSDFVLPQLIPSLFTMEALCYLSGQVSKEKLLGAISSVTQANQDAKRKYS